MESQTELAAESLAAKTTTSDVAMRKKLTNCQAGSITDCTFYIWRMILVRQWFTLLWTTAPCFPK